MKKNKFWGFFVALISLTVLFSSCIDFDDLFVDPSGQIEYVIDNSYFTSDELLEGDVIYLDWYYQYANQDYGYLVSETGAWDLFRIISSDNSVLSVGQNGKITAVSAGTASISVNAKDSHSYYSGYTLTFTVIKDKFYSHKISYMKLEKTNITVYTDSSYNLYYYLYSFDGYPYGGAVTVKSSDETVFTASTVSDYAGYVVINPVDEGTAELTVTSKADPSIKASCTVNIKDNFTPKYQTNTITLSQTSLSLDKNESYHLSATSFDKYGYTVTDPVSWSSSNKSVATVSKGVVTGVSSGTAVITATSKDNPSKYATCYVTVSNKTHIAITDIQFTSETYRITRGDSLSIQVVTTPSNPSNPLEWSASSTIISLSPDEQDSSKCVINALTEGSCVLSVKSSDDSACATCSIIVTKPVEGNAKQYFWGTWVRMDKGTEIIIDESSITVGNTKYTILGSSTDTVLKINGSIDGVTSLTKKTRNVMEAKIGDAVIPFYRKGGTDLNYSLKVVGFSDTIGRAAASTEGKSGLKVKGTSTRFASYEDEGTTDAEGNVSLKAPIQGDIQTVTIQVSDSKKITVENLKIENDGSYMGAIPIVEDDDPVLKVSGYIDEAQKTNGYMYSDESYIMTVYIKNIGDIQTNASVLEIKSVDDSIISIEGVDSTDGIPNPNAFTIPTLKAGKTLQRKIRVRVKDFSDAYIDTKIIVNVHSLTRTWEDYIPLRVYSGNATFTIAASSQVYNTKAALNGFIIYPDGNNQFFTVSHNMTTKINVPRFKNNDSYILVFSGATTDGELDDTTELFYTVSFDATKKEFTYNDSSISAQEQIAIINFGETSGGNETEDTAYSVSEAFEAYISEGEIDFFKINLSD
jgi:uncharacterized protein YjdB